MDAKELGIVYISQWKNLSRKTKSLCKCFTNFNGPFTAKQIVN